MHTRKNPLYTHGLLIAPLFFALAALLVVGYQRTLIRLDLVVDGQVRTLRTHQTTVEAVIREAGLALYPEDLVEPTLSEPVADGKTITIQRSRPVVVKVDGRIVEGRTRLADPKAVITALGVQLGEYDKIHLLPTEANAQDTQLLHMSVERARPVTIQESGKPPVRFSTTAQTVGEALYEAGIVLYLADGVRPPYNSLVEPATRISIDRSVPVTVLVDGRMYRTRTRLSSVGEVLADAGISLNGLDYAQPDLAAPLGDGQEIGVVRVREEVLVEQESIPFETQVAPDPELELDLKSVGQEGELGVYERRIRVRYENGVETGRWVEAEWVAKPPVAEIHYFGTKIVLHPLDTPSGPVQYWRKYRMLATSYNAASSGKAPDHPRYGMTRLGWPMRFGIVAVDPLVIALGSKVYVPGYGIGDAADTGGAIRNLRIDLGYDDDNLVSWYRCVDVYLLAPVPSNVQYVVSSLVHPWCR